MKQQVPRTLNVSLAWLCFLPPPPWCSLNSYNSSSLPQGRDHNTGCSINTRDGIRGTKMTSYQCSPKKRKYIKSQLTFLNSSSPPSPFPRNRTSSVLCLGSQRDILLANAASSLLEQEIPTVLCPCSCASDSSMERVRTHGTGNHPFPGDAVFSDG